MHREKNTLWSFFVINLCVTLMLAILIYVVIFCGTAYPYAVSFLTCCVVGLGIFTYYCYRAYKNYDEEEENWQN